MGGHEWTSPPSIPTRSENPLLRECSVIAMSKLFDVSTATIVGRIEANNKNNLFTGIGGMTKDGILDLISIYGINKVDMRLFNNKWRINTEYIPFPARSRGILALKFKGNNNTHWVAYDGGVIKDVDERYTSIKQIKKQYPKFDGFGHCILAYTNFSEELALESVYNNPCSSRDMCKKCIRQRYCFETTKPIKHGERPKRSLDS